MIIDIHTHIYPKEMRRNRKNYFSSEPAFELLYRSPKAQLIGAGKLLEAMDENRVDKSVIFGFPWQHTDTFRRHNDYILEMVAKYPKRFIGLGCFDPFNTAAATEAERCLKGGLSGIGELAFYQSGIDDVSLEQLQPIMEMCRERALPVLIHTNEPIGHVYPGKTENTLAQIYGLVNRFQNNKIILAHWGGGLFFFSLLKKEVKEHLKNTYFDTAASPFLYDTDIYRVALKVVQADKILFGSDYPLISPARYFKEMRDAGLEKEQLDGICGLNAKRLLNI